MEGTLSENSSGLKDGGGVLWHAGHKPEMREEHNHETVVEPGPACGPVRTIGRRVAVHAVDGGGTRKIHRQAADRNEGQTTSERRVVLARRDVSDDGCGESRRTAVSLESGHGEL